MAFNVRIFMHTGLAQMALPKPKQFSSDSVFQLTQPYEFGQVISVSSVAASSSPVADAPGRPVTILRIEVADLSTIRYEINPPGSSRVAGNASPRLTGNDQFEFRSGWTVSMIDAAGLP